MLLFLSLSLSFSFFGRQWGKAREFLAPVERAFVDEKATVSVGRVGYKV